MLCGAHLPSLRAGDPLRHPRLHIIYALLEAHSPLTSLPLAAEGTCRADGSALRGRESVRLTSNQYCRSHENELFDVSAKFL